jgi:hypothetical protein
MDSIALRPLHPRKWSPQHQLDPGAGLRANIYVENFRRMIRLKFTL